MKILLVNPYSGGYYYRLGAVYPPLGLMYISSSLKQKGHKVELIDMNVEKLLWKTFNFREYDVIGISTDTVRFPIAKEIAKRAKSQGVTVIIGGPHATAFHKEILREEICDYVILGEGEKTLPSLLEVLKARERNIFLPGVAYLKDGEVIAHSPSFIENLDEISFPDRSKVNLYRTKFAGRKATSLITSRGCPFNCEFCSASQFMGRKIRWRSIENVIEELELLKRMGYGSVIFFDDNFTINPKRVMRLCETMIERNLGFKWWAFSRADELLEKEDMVEAMAKAGCKMLFIGFESASNEVLEEYGKDMKSEIAFEVVKILKKYKIDIFASFVIGALRETKETIEKTIKFAKKLKASIVQFSILTPYPGTALFEKLKRKILEKDWRRYDGTHLVFKHPSFSQKELRKLFIKAYYSVYTSPRLIFRRGIPFLFRLIFHKEAYSL
ncbi:radical SAM protein [Thermotoga sp. KOL6]|uniref:B12-binding domain-containing radical SAM protein n=1 Tax=Thermotoga sp. KOL6 TaxID=126741 RepID=UPI000C791D43|nr:radical SAM protein [Thermotoga sp. KOL6]PLV60339.1 radical SAM protein [Thermotoga sp. KOL6]